MYLSVHLILWVFSNCVVNLVKQTTYIGSSNLIFLSNYDGSGADRMAGLDKIQKRKKALGVIGCC